MNITTENIQEVASVLEPLSDSEVRGMLAGMMIGVCGDVRKAKEQLTTMVTDCILFTKGDLHA